MPKEIGYYSLIQYCPDITIGEVATIGVLLFVPDSGFVDVRVTPTNQRAAHIFGGGIHKYDRLQRYKEGLRGWVEADSRKFRTLEQAKSFLAVSANSITFTPIRAIVCQDGAEKMIECLFTKFFPDDVTPQSEKSQRGPYLPKTRIFKALRTRYGNGIGSKLALLPELEVVGPERRVQPDFAFQNKHFNVVFSKSFNADRYDEQIGFGLLISREMRMARARYWKESVPIILGRIPHSKNSGNLSHEIAGAFKRLEIPFFDDEQKLIEYVGKEAQPLPSFVAKFAATKVEPSLFDAS